MSFPLNCPGIYSSAGNSSPAVSARCSGIRLSAGTAIAPGMAPWDISTSSLMSTIRYESLSSSCISSIVISDIFSALLPILSMPYLYHRLIFVIKCSVLTIYARLCGCFPALLFTIPAVCTKLALLNSACLKHIVKSVESE